MIRTPRDLMGGIFKEVTTESILRGLRVQQQTAARENLPPEFEMVIKLEAEGGPCPRCGKPWKKVEVRNEFALFDYYQPDCECWSVCGPALSHVWRVVKDRKNKDQSKYVISSRYVLRGCGSSKHREDAVGITRCLSCGFDPAREKKDYDKTTTSQIDRYREQFGV